MSFLFGGGNRREEREEFEDRQNELLDLLLGDLASQQEFLEAERETLTAEQQQAFSDLDAQLQLQLQQQQEGFADILNRSQGFISGLDAQNQELGNILQAQRDSQQQFRDDQFRELNNLNLFLSGAVGERRDNLNRSLGLINQGTESVIERALGDSPQFANRSGQLASEQEAETQELNRARRRNIGNLTERERRRREREQGSRLLSRRRGFARTNTNNRILRGT